jgi:uncharacterized protein DUF4339
MPRERWFYAKEMRRMGPLPKRQLVESLLGLPDPRGCLIWRHGLPAWTQAREVPEIDRQLAPFAKKESPPAPEPALAPAPAPGAVGAMPAAERTIRAPARIAARPARDVERPQQPSIALYFGGLAALLAVVVVGWLLWPRADDNEGPAPAPSVGEAKPRGAPLASARTGGARSEGAFPASPAAGATPFTERGSGAEIRGFAGWSDQEADLPPAELRRLRGVGGWSGNRLTITLYNGSTWRITEILVRTSRLRGDEFVDGEAPERLLPVGGAPVDAGTAELLKKVAPDRKKPGINPLDTGSLEATVGPQPEAYRWRIEGARGYPPRL